MAAGLGFKDFVTGEVLTAADVDGYLMQGVWVFASAAARDAAVTSPQEGNFAYLKDTNVTTYYTGSAWANLDTTGMTNPMTTTGDIIYSSPGSTPVRLGIGSTGNVLTVASGVPSWAAPAGGGGQTLLNSGSTALSGASVTWSSLSGAYKHLYLVGQNITISSGGGISLRLNGDSGANYTRNLVRQVNASAGVDAATGLTELPLGVATNSTGYSNAGRFQINFPLYSGSATKTLYSNTRCTNAGDSFTDFNIADWNNTAAVTSITILPSTGTFSTGDVYIYGVN